MAAISDPILVLGAVPEPTPDDAYLQILLTQSWQSGGMVVNLPEPGPPVPPSIQVPVIKGVTKSRLEEVMTYNPQIPFVVGLNGVISFNEDQVTYEIDGITYVTRLDEPNEPTIYILNQQTGLIPGGRNNAITRTSDSVALDEKLLTTGNIKPDRGEMSPWEAIYRLGRVNSPDDINVLF